MSEFRRYDHVERYGHVEVEGIDVGAVYVFPKIDGANASVWLDGDRLRAGSRNREVGPVGEEVRGHQGFWAWVEAHEAELRAALEPNPSWILYGEWLVPHTLKTYREEVWRRLWIFDVYDRATERYLSYPTYCAALDRAGLDVVSPLAQIQHPTESDVRRMVDHNFFLLADGCGVGEGVVVKNYEWRNRFGRQPWAKIVRNEFKEENRREFGVPERGGSFQVELAIAEEFVTPAFVAKTRAKVAALIHEERSLGSATLSDVEATHRSEMIPRLLQTCYHDLVVEEVWGAVKKHKDPTIDFKRLRHHVVARVKKMAGDLF